jgi:hypothetical protein
MSDPRFAWPDLCSISAANEQAEPVGAVCGEFSADGDCWAMMTHPHRPTLESAVIRCPAGRYSTGRLNPSPRKQ